MIDVRGRLLQYSIIFGAAVITCCLVPVNGAAQRGGRGGGGARAQAGPTPRTADGHPDFSGMWTGGGGFGGGGDEAAGGDAPAADQPKDYSFNFAARSVDGSGAGNIQIFNEDNTITRRMGANRPLYKPEYWEQIQKNDQTGNSADPAFNCLPEGVPRMGPPRKIVQTPTEIIFFYSNPDTYRIIPMDGRAHTPADKYEPSWKGESLGKWDGDTLVIDTTGFNDDSWLDLYGYAHSDQMHVVETMKRDGDKITWQATVEDSEMLLKPWVLNPRQITLNSNPKATLVESLPCVENDAAHIVGNEHH